jgi:hypothetical protein
VQAKHRSRFLQRIHPPGISVKKLTPAKIKPKSMTKKQGQVAKQLYHALSGQQRLFGKWW